MLASSALSFLASSVSIIWKKAAPYDRFDPEAVFSDDLRSTFIVFIINIIIYILGNEYIFVMHTDRQQPFKVRCGGAEVPTRAGVFFLIGFSCCFGVLDHASNSLVM